MRIHATTLAALLVLAACTDQPVAPAAQPAGPDLGAGSGGIIHRVTAGGPDICLRFDQHPGCDGNLSLVVLEWSDGSLTGQWEDAPDAHLSVDCLEVQDSAAWVGGVDREGIRWIIKVVDAGRSANDPPDSVSRRTMAGSDPTLCHRKPRGVLRATTTTVPQGQVSVE